MCFGFRPPAWLQAGISSFGFFYASHRRGAFFATCALNSIHSPPGILCRPGEKSRSRAVNNKPGSAQKRVRFLIPRETARKFCALIPRRHIIPNQNPKFEFRNPKLHIWQRNLKPARASSGPQAFMRLAGSVRGSKDLSAKDSRAREGRCRHRLDLRVKSNQ